jgi:hypothetical protein
LKIRKKDYWRWSMKTRITLKDGEREVVKEGYVVALFLGEPNIYVFPDAIMFHINQVPALIPDGKVKSMFEIPDFKDAWTDNWGYTSNPPVEDVEQLVKGEISLSEFYERNRDRTYLAEETYTYDKEKKLAEPLHLTGKLVKDSAQGALEEMFFRIHSDHYINEENRNNEIDLEEVVEFVKGAQTV